MNKKHVALELFLATALVFSLLFNAASIIHQDPRVTANVYLTENLGGVVSEIYAGNLITDIGETWIRDWIGLAGSGNTTSRNAAQWISLSNDASPSAAWTQLSTEVNADGFSRALGTVTGWVNSGDAAFNVSKTFTALGAQTLQCAGLQWVDTAESDGNLFAAAAFTQTTFNAADTLTITWVITVNAN